MDQTGTSGRIGISADASCQELTHIGAATTTLHYKQGNAIFINSLLKILQSHF